MDIQKIRGLFGRWNAHFISPLRGSVTVAPHTHGLRRGLHSFAASRLGLGAIACVIVVGISAAQAQSGGAQGQTQSQTPNQTQSPANSQSSQDIPDTPSAVQPPAPKPAPEPEAPPKPSQTPNPRQPSTDSFKQPGDQENPAPPKMPPVETVPPGSMPEASSQSSAPKNQINPTDDLYKISVTTNFVQIPVMVKDKQGRRVDDLGMADVSVQKVNQTYSALVGAFSPYDEVALYTYSSTVSRVTDFTGKPERLTATLDSLKLVRGHNNGPPVLGGPLGPQPPMVNGIPVGTSGPPPVYTPPKEAHVLNDAILRAALDLSKRDRTRRKVIFVISDGRELGSGASYNQVRMRRSPPRRATSTRSVTFLRRSRPVRHTAILRFGCLAMGRI